MKMKGWISWGDLLIYLVAGTAIYYAYLLLVYCRQQLKTKPGDQRPVAWKRELVQSLDKKEAPVKNNSTDVHELMEDIKEVLGAAVGDELDHAQILEAISIRLKKYPALKDSNFREAINQHITSEFSTGLQMTISPAEINSLW